MQSPLIIQKILYPYKAFYKVPYLVPPWGKEEINIFWRHFSGRDNMIADCLESRIKDKLQLNSNIIFLDSARHAIMVLLKTLSFPPESEIIVPVLCCSIIPKTIQECGLIPVFADIGEDLCLTVENINGVITSKTKGVMIVHVGGAVAEEYRKVVEFCKEKGLYFIDNAAPAWGNDIDGIWLGGRGDAGIISFGIGKSTFGIGGGALISNLPITTEKMTERETYNKLKLIKFYLKYFKRNYTAPFFMYLDKCMDNGVNNEIKLISYLDRALQSSISNNLGGLIKKRTEISLNIISILNKPSASFPQERNKHVWTKLIIKLPEKLKIKLQRYLYMKRIETEDYQYPHYLDKYWDDIANFSKSEYPSAEKIYRELLILPNSPGLTKTQLDYLYKTLEKFKINYL